jgi:L-2-hydroxyglutarate oxidase LhgO
MSDSWDSVIVGAGVVGLAIAAELTDAGLAPLVIERHTGPGRESSSRNSEVIHAGIYYPTGSLKARLCVEGNRLLYNYSKRERIAHRACGKLIIALDEEQERGLVGLLRQGEENGVEGLKLLSRAETRAIESNVIAQAGLYSPSSGIIDSHEFIKTLQARARNGGANMAFGHRLTGVERAAGAFELTVESSSGRVDQISTPLLINSAGLSADIVSRWAGVDCAKLWWCKGDYFSVQGGPKLEHLIYPPPQSQLVGLGIHATINLAGGLRLGPDTHYVDRSHPQFDVDPSKSERFFAAVEPYLPGLKREQLRPDTYGIRPKLQGPDDSWQDFSIQRVDVSGACSLINLLGIESPGLTAALAIGKYVACLAEGR